MIIPYRESKYTVIKEFIHEIAKQEKLNKKQLWEVFEPIAVSELFNPTDLIHDSNLSWSFDFFYFSPLAASSSDLVSLANFRKSGLMEQFELGLQYEDLKPFNYEFCMMFKIDKKFYLMSRSAQSLSDKCYFYLQPDETGVKPPYYICSMENFVPLIK